MKKLLLLFAVVLSFSLNSQYARMIAVDLKEGGEKEYLDLEKFWSQVHVEAVEKGLHNGWSIWKRTPKASDQESAAEYFIFESYSSLEQFENGYNPQELALEAYKGKMSSRAVARMMNTVGSESKERRNYTLQGVDQTIWAGGDLQPGDTMSLTPTQALSDDFENYETMFWMPYIEKAILNDSCE